jgi:hypothetical protein
VKRFLNSLSDTAWLCLLGGCVALVHILLNGQYGFHRDELDILMNARQLNWGYVAYPPFTPVIARISRELFGDALRGLRLFPALGQGLTVLLVGLMGRDMGARRPAQVMASIAAGIAPAALFAGTMIQYMSFDYLWWVVITFCFVRLLKSENPRWWLGIGAAMSMAMMTKYTAAFFIIGLAAGTLLTANRRWLRSPWLWAGAGLAFVIFLPNLVWQGQQGLISLDFLNAIHARDIRIGRTQDFLPEQFLLSANPFTTPLWVLGLGLLVFASGFKRFRLLGIAFLVTFGLLWVMRGRSYYVGPAYAILLAAGAVGWAAWLEGRGVGLHKVLLSVSWVVLAVGSLVGGVLVKPVAPLNSGLWDTVSEINGELAEMVGWQDLASQVAGIFRALPEEEKPRTVILAGNYGEAGAFDLYGPDYDLPPVISGSNSLWYRGYGDFEPQTVIVVGFELDYALMYFSTCEMSGQVTNAYNVKNEETTYHTGLYVCRQPRRPWSEMWQDMQWFQ